MCGCESVEHLLPLAVNGRLSEEEECAVALHLATCEACVDELALLIQFAESLKYAVEEECSPRQDQLDAVFDAMISVYGADGPRVETDENGEEAGEGSAEAPKITTWAVMDWVVSECPGFGWARTARRIYQRFRPDQFSPHIKLGPMTIGLR
ncbi:MAG: zf-HC2 domain-containing protein [Firmicutes bacterium]|nr:zf-HC2 domain-containing protein [Bacillota bacterium]